MILWVWPLGMTNLKKGFDHVEAWPEGAGSFPWKTDFRLLDVASLEVFQEACLRCFYHAPLAPYS